MKKNENGKSFDSVKFMRDARDQMSKEMQGKSAQEQISYIRSLSDKWIEQHEKNRSKAKV